MSGKRLSQRCLRELGIAEDQIAAEQAMTPQTTSGRGLDTGLAYDTSPESYLPGDYLQRYRAQIVAIEREAQALALDALEAAVPNLVIRHVPPPTNEGCEWPDLVPHDEAVAAVLDAIKQQRSKP